MPRPGNMLHLVTYDIPSDPAGDRRRTRLARRLEALGLRVQHSVFELDIDPLKLPSVCQTLCECIDPEVDSVRIYPLCGTCNAKVTMLGISAVLERDALIVW